MCPGLICFLFSAILLKYDDAIYASITFSCLFQFFYLLPHFSPLFACSVSIGDRYSQPFAETLLLLAYRYSFLPLPLFHCNRTKREFFEKGKSRDLENITATTEILKKKVTVTSKKKV